MVSLLDSIAKGTTAFLLVIFWIIVFFHGSLICGMVYKEPDICFLLATGRWIVEHGYIPPQDPFSYTAQLQPGINIFGHYIANRPILEKWLCEVLFFEIWSRCGGLALLFFTTCLSALSYVVLPLRILRLRGWKGLKALLLTTIVLTTSWSHLAVRGDAISFLLVAIWLELLVRVQKSRKIGINCPVIFLFACIDCFWANMNIVFLFGIILPAIYTFCLVVERFFPTIKLKPTPFNWTVPIALILGILATFINPWGIGLWEYIPFCIGKAVANINELQPLSYKNWNSLFFFGFYILVIMSLRSFWLYGLRIRESGDFWYRVLAPAGIAFSFKSVRSIPIGSLMLLTSIAGMSRPTPFKNELLAAVDGRVKKSFSPFSLRFTILALLVACSGTYFTSFAVPPVIPQSSAAFTVPEGAIKFISEHKPAGKMLSGNMLNDPHFGCVMYWLLKDAPPVFIDPRYNLFGYQIIQDYWTMVNCTDGWQDLLKKYDIGWVFLPPKLELVKRLSTDPDWHLLYEDKGSVIYQHNAN